jgi:DNA-binding LytR/AlgR family response regulator
MHKIVLIEDDKLYANQIEMILTKSEMQLFATFNNVNDAIRFCESNKVDLVLCDIFLEGELSGLDFLNLMVHNNIPIILMSSSIDEKIYEAAKKIQTVNYLTKPVQRLTLISTIEKLLKERKEFELDETRQENALFLNNNNKYVKVLYSDILWLRSDGNCTHIKTVAHKMTIYQSLVKTLKNLDSRFVRCHQKYGINTQHIIHFTHHEVLLISEQKIPIGRSYSKAFIQHLGLEHCSILN